jgi:hypothetical protein
MNPPPPLQDHPLLKRFSFRFDNVSWWSASGCCSILSHRMYLVICFRKSTPPQNRQTIAQ